MTSGTCTCGSADLFSGWFDADDLAHPLGLGEPTPEGVRWTTFCNECGAEVKTPKPKKGTHA